MKRLIIVLFFTFILVILDSFNNSKIKTLFIFEHIPHNNYIYDFRKDQLRFQVITNYKYFKVASYTNINEISNSNEQNIQKLNTYLKLHNSPLQKYSKDIINISSKYQIPWTLLVSIAGVESTFCKKIPQNSFNCYGWNNGKTFFNDYKEGLLIVTKGLRYNYFNKGYDTPEKISQKYAPNNQSWFPKITFFIDKINNQKTINLLSL